MNNNDYIFILIVGFSIIEYKGEFRFIYRVNIEKFGFNELEISLKKNR